jgi:hypothetical protein
MKSSIVETGKGRTVNFRRLHDTSRHLRLVMYNLKTSPFEVKREFIDDEGEGKKKKRV